MTDDYTGARVICLRRDQPSPVIGPELRPDQLVRHCWECECEIIIGPPTARMIEQGAIAVCWDCGRATAPINPGEREYLVNDEQRAFMNRLGFSDEQIDRAAAELAKRFERGLNP